MSISCDAALRSLDDSSNFLAESSAKLRAGALVDETRIVEHLKTASESARIVREAVLSELPDASWQNREELDALVEKIRIISEQRAAAQRRRSRLLALATALESGSIVHRRAQRSAELRQLRDHAIDELRSQAAVESPSSILPGPEADRWIEWACGLKEPEDTESLQHIRAAFPHLDNFIANLEPSMWMAGSSGATIEGGAEHATAMEEPEESRRHIDEPENLLQSSSRTRVESSTPADSIGERHEDRFSFSGPSAPSQPKPQPLDDEARMKEEFGRVQERKSLALAQLMVMGRTGDTVGSDYRPEQSTSTTAVLCETAAQPEIAPEVESSSSTAESARLAVMSEAEGSSTIAPAENVQLQQATGERAPSLSAEWLAAKFESEPDQSPFPYELYGLSVASGLNTPDAADENQKAAEERLRRSQERALARLAGIAGDQREKRTNSANAPTGKATPPMRGAASAADYPVDNAVQRALAGRGWILLAVVMALLLATGFLIWRRSRNTVSNRTRDPVQSALPAPSQSNPPELSTYTASPSEHQAPVAAPTTPKEQEPRPPDHSLVRDSSAKGEAAKPVGGHYALLRPTLSIPRHTRKEESAPAGAVAGGPINGVPNGMAKVLTTVPVVVPQVAPQKEKKTSSETVSAVLLRQVPPRYPLLAQQARIEGTVVLEGVIGTDGKLQNLRVVRGDPRLVHAAIDAAKQWRYKPSLLHGKPVESVTQININFSLTGG